MYDMAVVEMVMVDMVVIVDEGHLMRVVEEDYSMNVQAASVRTINKASIIERYPLDFLD